MKIEAVIDSRTTCSLIHTTARTLDLTIVEGFPISLKFESSEYQGVRNITVIYRTQNPW
jgi:hypothetical protein